MAVVPSTPAGTAPARPAWRQVLWLAWPVVCQQLLVFAVGVSDRFLAGNFEPVPFEVQAQGVGHQMLALGTLGGGQGLGSVLAAEAPWQAARQVRGMHLAYLSAQTTANYLNWFISSYIVIVSVGSTALVARFTGAGDRASAIRVTNQSLLLALVVGVIGSSAGLLGTSWITWGLQLQGEAARQAAAYLQPTFLLLTIQVLEAAGIACLIGAGDTRTGLFVLGGVAVLNVPLSWLAFHGIGPVPAMGFVGISWGTAWSHGLGGLAVLLLLYRGRAGLHWRPAELLPDPSLIYRILRVSIPAAADSLSLVLGQFWYLGIVNLLGDAASSAHGIAITWESLGFLSGAAFGTAAMTLVGQGLGAGQPARAARDGWTAFALGCGVMCAMGVVFAVLAPTLFLFFCPHEDQRPVIELGVPVLRLVAFAMPAVACTVIFTSALRGAGDTRVPVLFTWIGFLGVRIPLAYLLSQTRLDLGPLGVIPGADLGLFGAWLAMFVDLYVRGALLLFRFAGGRWQRMWV